MSTASFTGKKRICQRKSHEAQDLQQQAITYGTEYRLRFNDDSKVKVHALIEIDLTCSAANHDGLLH